MKKLFIFVFIILLLGFVHGTQTISNFKTNTPVPIDTLLVATGQYTDSNSAAAVFCEFVVLDPDRNYTAIDRYSSEQTFAGNIYTQKNITEPPYFRTSTYILRASCGTATADANFTVGQRRSITNQFFGEIFFIRDNGQTWVYIVAFFLIVVGVLGVIYAIIKKVWNP